MAQETAVVIVNWNGAQFLESLLKSLEAEQPAEIVVVDNASSDASREILARYASIKTILNSNNAGFGTAANQGIEFTEAPFVLLMNNDTQVVEGALGTLEEYLQSHEKFAIAAPALVFPDGKLQPSLRRFPTVRRIFLYLSYLDRVFPSGYRLKSEEHQAAEDVEQPMGASLLLRRSSLQQVGYFDPQFFMYMEEVDLCRRLSDAGWLIAYVSQARVLHHAGGSSDQAWERTQREYLESVVRYFKKHGSPLQIVCLRCAIPAALLIRAVAYAFRLRFRQAGFYLRSAAVFPFIRPL